MLYIRQYIVFVICVKIIEIHYDSNVFLNEKHNKLYVQKQFIMRKHSA
jgi:hypothetical protein